MQIDWKWNKNCVKFHLQFLVLICLVITITNVKCQQNYPYAFNGFGARRPQYQSNYQGGDQISFPDSEPPGRFFDEARPPNGRNFDAPQPNGYRNRNEIEPLPMNMSKIGSYDDFFALIDKESVDSREIIVPRIGGESIERSAAKRPVPANCRPYDTIVPLELLDPAENSNPLIVKFPKCTTVKRCGGCDCVSLLSCQPTEIEQIPFEVYKAKYINGSKMQFRGKEIVVVEQHNKCECKCKVKESDCSQFQRYDKAICSCVCINTEDRNKCLDDKENRIWDATNCVCGCRKSRVCSTGQYFDENRCACLTTPGFRNTHQIEERRKFILKPIYVPETPETIYQT